jgi:hypothetical protein
MGRLPVIIASCARGFFTGSISVKHRVSISTGFDPLDRVGRCISSCPYVRSGMALVASGLSRISDRSFEAEISVE